MLLVANGSVFTRNAQTPFIPNGAVAIDGDTIVEVGPERELKVKYPDAEYVDAQGNLIMPGLINCHTHIYSGLARGLAIKGCNPTNFLENLEQQSNCVRCIFGPGSIASRGLLFGAPPHAEAASQNWRSEWGVLSGRASSGKRIPESAPGMGRTFRNGPQPETASQNFAPEWDAVSG
ncbi:imidazolonepropionase-like domain-containing protein [Collinsella sp. HCP28S3_H5]|uniref:imidazolonepropionase-like domain-containing protein n=1 Tax=unclassified Collinsella TaxID=2637548 RepID=UPI003F899494